MLHAYIVRTCKCRQDGDEREKSWKSIRLPIQLHIPRLPIPHPKKREEEDGNHPIVSYLLVSFSLPFWQMSASNFLERYRNKRAVPSTSKRKILLLFLFCSFPLLRVPYFPFRVILARWLREPIPQCYHHLFFPFFSKENLVIKGSKAKK